jgi:PAS domain S-box-containing protein
MKIAFKKILKLLFFVLIYSGNSFADAKPKVLILHSYHPAYKWTNDINKGINSVFNNVTKVDLYVEYMDTKQYVETEYIDILTSIYRKKYKNIKFDVIISSDDNAFNFLKKNTKELFQNTPIVFCGTNNIKKEDIEGFKNFTGVNEGVNLNKNYDLILKLHPNVKNIYTITDTTTTGKLVRKEVLSRIKKYKDLDIKFHILDDMTLDELVNNMKNLPDNSVALFTVYFRTKDNKFLSYYKAIEKIEKHTKTPIYGLWDFTLGHGIIGGYLTSGYFQGKKAAEMAKDILSGIPVEAIPILLKSPNKYMFDYKQIQKYNINENSIPFNTIFINKKNSLLEVYFKEIIGLAILFIMMLLFIVILLINIKKRKKAEEKISRQLSFQQNLIDNVNTPIYYKNTKREYIGCNKAFLELLEVNKSEILHKNAYYLNDIQTGQFIDLKDLELLKNRKPQEYERTITRKDGTHKNMILYKNIFFEDGEPGGIIGALFDITEIKSLNYDLNRLLSTFDTNVIASKTNIDGKMIYVSKAFTKISGYSEVELLGRSHNILRSYINDEKLYEQLWDTISNKKIWHGQLINKDKEGHLYTLQTVITPEYDKDGNFLNYTSISQDITDQKLVENAKKEIEVLNQDIVETQKEIIFRLGALAESRSKETGLHVRRVAKYSELLALYYGINKEEAEIIKTASPMHDIGKIAIPDVILNKPSRYTPEEFEIMKTHAKIGYDMLKDSNKEILKAASIIAYEHQEKYDGSGYPRGLKGEDIHIYGRITAVADVFDALGSARVYKKAWNDKDIFELFENESGKHFDPVLIKIFFDNLDEFLKIRDEMKDII